MLALLLAAAPVGASGNPFSPILTPRQAAPTLPGAPFLPSAEREDIVLERLDILTQLDELELAREALTARVRAETLGFRGEGRVYNAPIPESTERILASRAAGLKRDLAKLEEQASGLLAETEPFSMGFAAFPVVELRKPFFNDWGRPRSGGRRHKGTDLLAQIGVPLRAIEDGYVERASNGSLGGLSLYLIGDSGSRYYYAHMDEISDVVDGQRVYAGQIVGTNGDSGNARGAPHLHMQWAPTGESNWENPFPLLDVLFGEGAAAEALEAVDEVPSIDGSDRTYLLDSGT